MAIRCVEFVYGILALCAVASEGVLLESRAGKYAPKFTSTSEFVEWMVRRANGDRSSLVAALDAHSVPTVASEDTQQPAEQDVDNAKRMNAMNVLEQKAAPNEAQLRKKLTKEAVLEDLWGGQDFDDNFMNLAELQTQSSAQEAEGKVQVLGLQRSGVDLLNALLYMNFGDRLKYHSEPKNGTHYAPGVWKHANIKMKFREEPIMMRSIWQDAVKAIMVVRNPLAWLRTLRVSPPLEWHDCIARDDWLSEGCEHPYPCGAGSPVPGHNFSSLERIWNIWTDGYTNAAANGVPSHMVTTYENIVRDPKGTVSRISAFLSIDPPSSIVVPDELGEHGQTVALNRIRKQSYIDSFSAADLKKACAELDPVPQQLYRYTECTDLSAGSASPTDSK